MTEIATGEALFLALGGLILGIIMLVKGGDWAVDAAVFLAERIGMSHLVIGFTIIAFGTSLPELIVGVNANLDGSPGIAIGNVLGSHIANILMVGGMAALVAPIVCSSKELPRQVYFMLGATVLLAGLIVFGEINRIAGLVMVLLLLGYVYYEYQLAKSGALEVEEIEEPSYSSTWSAVGFLLVGFFIVTLGAEFMVGSAQLAASIIGIPEAVIALTIIAFGTSLPELSTCMVAMAKKHGDIVLGNLIGSNVFNILMIMGVTALAKPIVQGDFSEQIVTIDIWITLGVTILFSIGILFFNRISKPIGIIFVAGYVVYIVTLYALYLPEIMSKTGVS